MRLDFLHQSPDAALPNAPKRAQPWWARLFSPKAKPAPPAQQFDTPAQNAIFYAQSEAKRRGAARVDTEHLLIGVLRERDHSAARAFAHLGLDRQAVFLKIDSLAGFGANRLAWSHDLAPRAKRALAFAFAEAREMNDARLGVEHLLLGLVREGEGKAACALDELGLDLDRARQAVRAVKPHGTKATVLSWWRRTFGLHAS